MAAYRECALSNHRQAGDRGRTRVMPMQRPNRHSACLVEREDTGHE